MPEQNASAIAQTRQQAPASMPALADPDNGYSRTPADLPPGPAGINGMPPTNGVGGTSGAAQAAGASISPEDAWALRKALDLYTNSTSYMEANITLEWERNLYHFRSEHRPSSPYGRSNWRRARTFRHKTRANVKAQEAAHAAAAFSTDDYLDVRAFDPTNEQQVISAAVCKALMQYRLKNTPWNWFLTAQGAYQDTKVYGVCISHQYWRYEQIEEIVPAFDDQGLPIMGQDASGQAVPMGESRMRTIADMPVCDLIAPELFLFDPMCDWRNPAQTSPYLVYMMPIYAGEALRMMQSKDPKTGQPMWRKYSLGQLLATRKQNIDDRTRRAREGHHRVDPTLAEVSNEFAMLWAHLNIVREDGVDVAYWTMGTQLVLTDPIPLTEMYPHLAPGERPFAVGFSVIETHRNYPSGDVGQIAPLQEEINAVANQRLDNVRLVLNKRYFVRRGSQIDLDALMRNVPGGGVMTNDPERDVVTVPTPDVTSSSYQEQDRLAMDLDELVGGFGQNAVAQSGKMVDRAGSLDQIQGAAGAVQDYSIRIFWNTWMENVLKQLVKLEQMYETDQTILAVAAKQSPLWLRYGMDTVTDEYLQHDLIVQINVGMGNTDPVKRVQKLSFGVGQVLQLPNMMPRAKSDEIANEIFGSLGYKDASRFFMTDQEFAQHIKQNPPQPPPEVQLKNRELDIRENTEKARDIRENRQIDLDHDFKMRSLGFDEEKLQHNTGIAAAKNKTVRDVAAAKESNRMAEINMSRAHSARSRGTPGKPPGS